MTNKLLINQPPIMYQPMLAASIGLREAILVQQIHFWARTNQEVGNRNYFRDEHWWAVALSEWWQNRLAFPASTFWRVLRALRDREDPLIFSFRESDGRGNPLWLRVNYNALNDIAELMNSEPSVSLPPEKPILEI